MILTPEQVAGYAYRAGFRGQAIATMVAITGAESGYDTAALGDLTIQDRTWGPSVGLGQVRSLKADKGTGRDRDELANLDPFHNLLACYHISGGGANFRPWSTYTSGAYMRHLADAQAGAGVVSARGGTPDTWATMPAVRTDDRLRPITDYANAPTVAPDLPLTVRGRALEGSIDDYVTAGEVDLTVDAIWQLSFTVDDPGLAGLWESGLFVIGTPVDTADIHWQVAAVEVSQGPAAEQVEVTLRTAGAEKAKQARFPRTESDVSAFTFVAHDAAEFGLIVTGGKADRSAYATRSSVGRNPANTSDKVQSNNLGESAWECWQRLAGEAGAWCWEGAYNTLYFGAPSRIMNDSIGLRVVWRPAPGEEHLAPLEVPRCRRTNDDPLLLAEITVKLPPSRGRQVRPGMGLTLAGIKGFEATYIVTRVNWNLDRQLQPVTVTAVTPRDPTPSDADELALTPAGAAAAIAASTGVKGSALDFVNYCLRQAGKRYVYGAEVDLDDPDPDAFDCSELVQWAAAQVGVSAPDGSGNQYQASKKAGLLIPIADAAKIRGALLFRGPAGSDHVAVSLGDGANTIEARGREYGVLKVANILTRGWSAAGLLPGLSYNGQDSTVTATKLGTELTRFGVG